MKTKERLERLAILGVEIHQISQQELQLTDMPAIGWYDDGATEYIGKQISRPRSIINGMKAVLKAEGVSQLKWKNAEYKDISVEEHYIIKTTPDSFAYKFFLPERSYLDHKPKYPQYDFPLKNILNSTICANHGYSSISEVLELIEDNGVDEFFYRSRHLGPLRAGKIFSKLEEIGALDLSDELTKCKKANWEIRGNHLEFKNRPKLYKRNINGKE